MAQRRLTKEQIDKFYTEYTRMKTIGNYAGELMGVAEWKNQMEELLAEDATGVNWSNTEIRKASHQLARQNSWSKKQISALIENILKSDREDAVELRIAMIEAFGPVNLESLIKKNQAVVYQFLMNYSGNWNQYFNS